MVLKGKSKIVKSSNSYTQYVTIPSSITRDSQFPFTGGEEVEIIIDPDTKQIIIKEKGATENGN